MEVSDVLTLLDAGKRRKADASKGIVAWVRDPETGELVKRNGVKPGQFKGKQGSKRRSRKGAVRTMPNGYVQYCPNWDEEVFSYVVR